MSHQTKLKNKVRGPEAISKAAADLGFEVLPAGEFRGYYGNSGHADIILRHPDCRFDVGLIENKDGSYTISTDFWTYGCKSTMVDLIGLNGNELVQRVSRHNAVDAAEVEGLFVETEERLDDGTLELTLTGF